ncbi:MAG: amidohydrolase [Candidatus Krumholzibacteriia bacterium]
MSRRGDRILIENGRVRTLDPACPEAHWVLVENGVVRRVGFGQLQVAEPVRRFDLRGRTLIPAFCDAHVHLTWIATSFLGPDLSTSGSVESVLEKLGSWRGGGRGPDDAWIVADGFDETSWKDRRLPTRLEIDHVESSRPVLVKRVCGHVGVVNSKALEALPGGPHTDAGSGRIAESDLWALNDRLRPDPRQLAAALPRVIAALHAHGITAVHDVSSPEMLRALQLARAAEAMALRVSCALPVQHLDALIACGVQRGFGDAWLRVLGVKIFVDGSLGARTAHLRQPYADAPHSCGTPLYGVEELEAIARRAHGAGLQLMIHAIGDAALERVLDAVPALASEGNPVRHRLEHVEVTPPDLVDRLAVSGLHACVQPNFAGRWSPPGAMNEQRLGTRLAHCNAYRSMLDAGVPLAFGSDCMPIGPLFGLRSAVAHPVVAQRLDAATALELYTAAAAKLVHAESRLGRIAPGFAADLVVLSHDPLDAGALPDTRVDASFLAGQLVHERTA